MANIKIPDLSQATNLQDSDLLVLEQGTGTNKIDLGSLFNTNRGLQINDDGISNVFADLSSIDVNTVQYNYQGYVANCTNLPTGYTHGQLICLTGTGTGAECEQLFSPWNENSIYTRAYYGSAWTDWQKLTAEFDLPANTDLNTVTYNFRGYAPTPTNAPTSGSFNLDVVCRKDGLSGQQIASKYNDTVVYARTWYTSSGTRRWNDWKRVITEPVDLWENPSVNTSFSPQTLTLDLSKYSFAVIQTKIVANSSYYITSVIKINGYDNVIIGKVNSSAELKSRLVVVRTNNVQFYNAYTGSTLDNSSMIPFKIWGW